MMAWKMLRKLLLLMIGSSLAELNVITESRSATVSWYGTGNAEVTLTKLDTLRSIPIQEYGRMGQHSFRNLEPGTPYRVDIIADGRERESVKFTTKPMPLKQIRVSKFLNPTHNNDNRPVYGAVLYWDSPDGDLDGYAIDVSPKHGEIKTPIVEKKGTYEQDNKIPRRVVTNLTPGEQYNFTISSTAGNEMSKPVMLQTRIPPEIPGDIRLLEIGSRGALLDWQREHRGYLDGFYLETVPPDAIINQPRQLSDKVREVRNLKPGKKYQVKVHSTAYGLLSFRPSERSIITLPEAPLGDLVVISQDPVNVTIQWTPPDGEAQMYQVVYYPTDRDARKLKELSINSTITLTNMDPGTEYQFEIETISNGLHSDPMIAEVITTPDPIENLEVLNKDFTSVSLGWSHNEQGDALYVVEYNPNEQSSWPVSPFLSGDSVVAIDGLTPGKKYNFVIKAVVGNVESPSRKISAILPIPSKPSNVTIDVVTDDSFDVSWESPYEDAVYVVNVLGPEGQLDNFPINVEDTTATIDGLESGSVYRVTVATVVDGYTTDKHALAVETFESSSSTMLFPIYDESDMPKAPEELQLEFDEFSKFIGEGHPESGVDFVVDRIETIDDREYAVVNADIYAKPSDVSVMSLNSLYGEWEPEQGKPGAGFSEPINGANECNRENNKCSENAQCEDHPILYRCKCKSQYDDVTTFDETDLVNLRGQVCIARPDDNCVKTNWRFKRNGYVVVRRQMPSVDAYTVCFKARLGSTRMRGILTTYRHEGTILSMKSDEKGNLEITVNDEKLYAPDGLFEKDQDVDICMTASSDDISFYLDGNVIDSRVPSGSVALAGGGKIQIGRDPECNKKCERVIGTLTATIMDYTIWSKVLSVNEISRFQSGMCVTGAAMTLEQDAVDTRGDVEKEYTDEMFSDGLIGPRFWTTPGTPVTSPGPGPQHNAHKTFFMGMPPWDRGVDFNNEGEEPVVSIIQSDPFTNTLIGDDDDLETFCNPDNMTIVVDKALIDEYELRYGKLTLEDPTCERQLRGDHYVWEISPDLLGCGSSIELSDTHVTFVNSLSTEASDFGQIEATDGIIFGNQLSQSQTTKVSMSVSCQFPLDYTVTADYPFLPQITIQLLKFNVSGHGEFSALMQLFEDEQYEQPFSASPSIEEGELIRVGINLVETEDPKIRVTTQNCWATPDQDPFGTLNHMLINDGCGVDGVLDGTLDIIENGMSKRARWEGAVFKFVGYDEVWLHCDIRVCFEHEDCIPVCGGRRRRDANGDVEIVTISTTYPIRRITEEDFIDEFPIIKEKSDISQSLLTGLIAGITAVTLLLLNCVGCFIIRRRRTKQLEAMEN